MKSSAKLAFGAPIVIGMLLFGIGHAFIYRSVSPAWPAGRARRQVDDRARQWVYSPPDRSLAGGRLMVRMRFLVLAAAAHMFAAPAMAGGLTSQLLLSSAWCSFSYNQTSGYSKTTRVRFNANGTFSSGGRGEGGSSGPWGSVASQKDSSAGGYWRVDRGELYMSDGGPLEPVQTRLKRNGNGYPIIVADGVEYSQCR